jgi:phosphate/sulfate permease
VVAIPLSFLLCTCGFAVALTTGMATDGYEDAAIDYRDAILGSFIYGSIIFIGTSWFVIPLVGVLIAIIRLVLRRRHTDS